MKELKGQVFIVTGASSGIGEQIAIKLAQQGATIILAARNMTRLNHLACELRKNDKAEAVAMYLDLGQAEVIDGFVDSIIEQYGKIDGLINSSGLGIFKPIQEIMYSDIYNQFSVNTLGTMYLSTKVAQEMVDQKSGHIVFIASIAGYLITPSSSVYSASKSAIIMFANGLRLELAPYNIKVTTVNPGPVKTPFFSHTEAMKAYYRRVKLLAIKPENLAQDIVGNILNKGKKREMMRPRLLKLIPLLYYLAPSASDWFIRRFMNHKEEKK